MALLWLRGWDLLLKSLLKGEKNPNEQHPFSLDKADLGLSKAEALKHLSICDNDIFKSNVHLYFYI